MAFPRFVLAGDWRRFIGDRQVDFVRVPGSHRPIGDCRLEHTFARPWPVDKSRRVFLVTEGVLATAEFSLNGQSIGRAGPWARYRFEIAPELLLDQNTLTVHLRDTVESFGPPPGRRFDGGLIRPLWLESRPVTFLEDFRFTAELDADCTRAQCEVAVEFNGLTPLPVRVVMAERDTGVIVVDTQATAAAPARFTLDQPRLWSPHRPNLYTLTVHASDEGELLTESVGVRRIEARGQDFYLNNERLILKGVCRHEFTSRSGYSPPEGEIRRELALIKHAGFNFIRLVHSPQGPEVCRIAAELGLLVSEEPGTCFHDLA
ncbi:MAG: hypothetical protein IT441_04615, partial [Phycisphaeraceae bacterium]|nr:hypothetical protein [Phycisphaeraceae bacterium]